MEIKKYPDGTSYVVIKDGVEGLRQANETIFIDGNFHNKVTLTEIRERLS